MTYYLFLIIGAAATILTHLRGSAKARAAARSVTSAFNGAQPA